MSGEIAGLLRKYGFVSGKAGIRKAVYNVSLENFESVEENTLYVFSNVPRDGNGLRTVLKMGFFLGDTPVKDSSFSLRVLSRDNKVVLSYCPVKNSFTLNFDLAYVEKYGSWFMKKMARFAIGIMPFVRKLAVNGGEVNYSFAELAFLLRNTVVREISTVPLDTSKCKGRLIIDRGKVIYYRPFKIEISKVVVGEKVYSLTEHAKYSSVLVLVADLSSGKVRVYSEKTDFSYNGEVFQHPNVRDGSGEVCLGDYAPEIDFSKEVCSQLEAIAEKILEMLRAPSNNAYNDEFIKYVVETGKATGGGVDWVG